MALSQWCCAYGGQMFESEDKNKMNKKLYDLLIRELKFFSSGVVLNEINFTTFFTSDKL